MILTLGRFQTLRFWISLAFIEAMHISRRKQRPNNERNVAKWHSLLLIRWQSDLPKLVRQQAQTGTKGSDPFCCVQVARAFKNYWAVRWRNVQQKENSVHDGKWERVLLSCVGVLPVNKPPKYFSWENYLDPPPPRPKKNKSHNRYYLSVYFIAVDFKNALWWRNGLVLRSNG